MNDAHGPAGQSQTTTVDRPAANRTGTRQEMHSGVLEFGTLVGRYHLLDCLGRGGMSVVYLAFDPQLDRKLAIKLLRLRHRRSSAQAARRRLLREAQALARLSHPNVITVHDVGSFDDQVFVAMELVDGETLGRWRLRLRPSWRSVLQVFQQAGQGLAAAHRVGLVHRDFKPGNVMIGRDGRVRVLDFGLARLLDEPTTESRQLAAGDPEAAPALASPPSPGELGLTEPGTALGTPAYMAPEQHADSPSADARSDQFSFCVALYEALYHQLPFAGDTHEELRQQTLQGKLRPPPVDSAAPGWIFQVLKRGLQPDPELRWPAMDALLAALEHDPEAGPRRRRRQLVAASLGVALLGLVATGWMSRSGARAQPCQGAAEKWRQVWDSGQKRHLQQAFRTTGAQAADAAWRQVTRRLDEYTAGWTTMHTEACTATHVRGEQSPELLDRRMYCLERRRQEVAALVQLLAHADTALVTRATQAVDKLGPLADCADLERLTGTVAPPADPALRQRVLELERRLAEVRALQRAGALVAAVVPARQLAVEAQDLGHAPLAAEALWSLAELQQQTGEVLAAEETLIRTLRQAEEGRLDALRARAAIALGSLVGSELGRFQQGRQWLHLAGGMIRRLGGDPQLERAEREAAARIRAAQAGRAPAR